MTLSGLKVDDKPKRINQDVVSITTASKPKPIAKSKERAHYWPFGSVPAKLPAGLLIGIILTMLTIFIFSDMDNEMLGFFRLMGGMVLLFGVCMAGFMWMLNRDRS